MPVEPEDQPKKPTRKPLPKGSVKQPLKAKRAPQAAEPEAVQKEPSEIVKIFLKIQTEIERYPSVYAIYRRINSPLGRSGIALAMMGVIGALFYTNYNAERTAEMSADIQRVSNLQELRLKIDGIYAEQKELPSSLKDIEERPNPYFVRDEYMYDVNSARQFEYKPTGASTYQLCAIFDFSTVAIAHQVPSDVNNPIWNHDSGHFCFAINAVSAGADRPPDAVDLSAVPTPKPVQ